MLPHAKAGRLKVLGVPGFEASSWQGVLAPARTPRPVIDWLHQEIVKALRSPEVERRLLAEGSEIGGGSPEAFAAYIRNEIAKWIRVVKEAGIRVE